MSRILITGGAGFVGAHTARYLMDAGEEVFIYDFFHQYSFPLQPTFLENMNYRFEGLLQGANILRGSTSNKDNLRRVILDVQPEYIIHLAALPLANVALRQTEEAFEGIVQGTVNVLEVLRDVDSIKNFVYVSSSMVYGDFKRVPMPEDEPKDPKEIYGGMKLAGEILVQVFSKRHNIPYAIVRPSAVYGPTDNNRRVLQIFVEKAMRNEVIEAVNPDTSFLDFSYVEDTAAGLAQVAMSPNSIGQAFNITRGEGRSLSDAISILRQYFPDVQVKATGDTENYRPNRGALDVSKARELVGYNPKHGLEEGLAKYIEYVRTYNKSLQPGGNG